MSDSKERSQRSRERYADETPRARARRLIKKRWSKLSKAEGSFNEWLFSYGRFLASEDKREILSWCEANLEQVRLILDGIGERPEPGFSSELLDEEDL